MTRIERMMAEVLLLQERGRSCEELARSLEVSRRTIIRDIQSLCEMGVPVASRDGVGGGYSLVSGFAATPLELTWQEALLLVMALDSLSKMSDSPFSAERSSLAAKLRLLIPDKHLARLDGMRGSVSIEIPERGTRAPMLDSLVEIVGSGAWIAMKYDAADGVADRLIRPDRVYTDRGFWYLVGSNGQTSRTMRVDRILSFESAEAPVSVVEPIAYDDPSHPLIEVRLTRKGARVAQRDPHFGSSVNPDLDSQVLRLRCPPSEFDWYAGYFGGMGVDAEVLGPPELRQQIRIRANNLLDLYRENS